MNDVSIVLRNSYGVTGRATLQHDVEQKLRAVPSGGASYPLEIYAACFNVEGVEPGVYHYNVQEESLECVRQGQFSAEFGRICFTEAMSSKLPMLVIISGILKLEGAFEHSRCHNFIRFTEPRLAGLLSKSSNPNRRRDDDYEPVD